MLCCSQLERLFVATFLWLRAEDEVVAIVLFWFAEQDCASCCPIEMLSELARTRLGVPDSSRLSIASLMQILAFNSRSQSRAGVTPLELWSVLGDVFAVQLENLLVASLSSLATELLLVVATASALWMLR